jgi:predicted DNA-binding transcriptional regulator AlpA
MSLEHSPAKQRRHGGTPFTVDDLQILTVRQWAALITVSLPTAKRMIKNGDAPKIIQLSAKRIGIRVGDHRAWLAAQERVV